MIKLIKVYTTPKTSKLRAKIKYNGKILTVRAGQQLPKEIFKNAHISLIHQENNSRFIEVKTLHSVLRFGSYELTSSVKFNNF